MQNPNHPTVIRGVTRFDLDRKPTVEMTFDHTRHGLAKWRVVIEADRMADPPKVDLTNEDVRQMPDGIVLKNLGLRIRITPR